MRADRAETLNSEAIATAATLLVAPAATTLAALYANRAAARLMLGSSRIRDALSDCLQAISTDAGFERARVRATDCHVRLGEFNAAQALWEGIQAEQLPGSVSISLKSARSAQALLCRARGCLTDSGALLPPPPEPGASAENVNAAGGVKAALDALALALEAAPAAAEVLLLRSEALLCCRSFGDAAEAAKAACGCASTAYATVVTPWAGWCTGRAQLGLGDMAACCASLEAAAAVAGDKPVPGLTELAAVVAKADHERSRGNAAFKAQRYEAAVEAYSAGMAALAPGTRLGGPAAAAAAAAAAAVLLSNRAASLHQQRALLDALADVGRALALCPSHAKALSRRATLHMELRCSAEAVADLNCLAALPGVMAGEHGADLASRLAAATSAARAKPTPAPPDAFKLLGLPPSAAADDVRKAYRKLALKLHPDKAAHALPPALVAGLESELAADAERLFKLASAAHATLADAASRREYEREELARSARASYPPSSSYEGSRGYPARGRAHAPHRPASYSGYHWTGGQRAGGTFADSEEEEDDDDESFQPFYGRARGGPGQPGPSAHAGRWQARR